MRAVFASLVPTANRAIAKEKCVQIIWRDSASLVPLVPRVIRNGSSPLRWISARHNMIPRAISSPVRINLGCAHCARSSEWPCRLIVSSRLHEVNQRRRDERSRSMRFNATCANSTVTWRERARMHRDLPQADMADTRRAAAVVAAAAMCAICPQSNASDAARSVTTPICASTSAVSRLRVAGFCRRVCARRIA